LLALCALQAGHRAPASVAIERALSADRRTASRSYSTGAIAAGIDPDTGAGGQPAL
jgi:hypothetical protein